MTAPVRGRVAPPAAAPFWLVLLLAAVVTAAVMAGLSLGAGGPAPAPVPVFTPPSYFCPAGQQLVSPDGPQCKPASKPLPAVPLTGLEGK